MRKAKPPYRCSALLTFLATGLAIGCAGGGSLSEAHQSRSERIVGGTDSPVGSADDAVLQFAATFSDGFTRVCTASLLTPRLVLTAKHCVAQTKSGGLACTTEGSLVTPGGPGTFLSGADPEVEVSLPGAPKKAKGQRIITTDTTDTCRDDIAFVVLETALDLPTIPVRTARTTVPGETLFLLGYGTGKPATATTPRQRHANISVTKVGPPSVSDTEVRTTAPRTFVIPGATACFGDSGGPAISATTGAVLGVYSRIDGSDCAVTSAENSYTEVKYFVDLLAQAEALSGGQAKREELVKEGAACVVGSECESGSCEARTCRAVVDAGQVAEVVTPAPSGCSQTGRRGNAEAALAFGLVMIGLLARRKLRAA